eukprot:3245781-Heterocapsa_arctica.AAC.2
MASLDGFALIPAHCPGFASLGEDSDPIVARLPEPSHDTTTVEGARLEFPDPSVVEPPSVE